MATTEKKPSKYAAQENDPFSEFSSFASKPAAEPKNEFGDFNDFDDFSPTKPVSSSPKKVEKKAENIDFFSFDEKKEEEDGFRTNNVQNL